MSTAVARPTAMDGFVRGVALAASRLRWAAVIGIVVLCLAVVAAGALVLRMRAPLDAPGQVLGLVLRWVVPLAAFALTAMCVGRARMDDSVWPVCAHGLARRHVVLGVTALAVGMCALLATVAVAVGLALAYGSTPGLAADLPTSAWIGALGGASYAAWFLLGSSFLRLGRGRWFPLVADFTLGGTAGIFAVVWPRAHLENLVGGEAVLDISQATSSVVLAAITAVLVIVAAMRAGD